MSKKESTTLSLLMSGFSTNHPMVVIRPRNMANQRLLINYTGTAADNSLTLEQVKQSLGILTRRYGKVEGILTIRDFLLMVVNRSEIENDIKIKVSHTKFSIMFGHGGKRYFVIPSKNSVDPLSFGQHSFNRDAVNSLVAELPRSKLLVTFRTPELMGDSKGISVNQELVIPPAIQSTINNYLKDE